MDYFVRSNEDDENPRTIHIKFLDSQIDCKKVKFSASFDYYDQENQQINFYFREDNKDFKTYATFLTCYDNFIQDNPDQVFSAPKVQIWDDTNFYLLGYLTQFDSENPESPQVITINPSRSIRQFLDEQLPPELTNIITGLSEPDRDNILATVQNDLNFIFVDSLGNLNLDEKLIARTYRRIRNALVPDFSRSTYPEHITAHLRESVRKAQRLQMKARKLQTQILQLTDQIEEKKSDYVSSEKFITHWLATYMWLDARPYMANELYQLFLDHADVLMPNDDVQEPFTVLFQANGAVGPGQAVIEPAELQKKLMKDYNDTINNIRFIH